MSAGRAIGLLLAVAADGVLGNPKATPVLAGFSRLSRRLAPGTDARHPWSDAAYAGSLVGGAVLAGVLAERLAGRPPVAQVFGTGATTWAVLGGARLALEGAELARYLDTGELDDARATLTRLDGGSVHADDVLGLSRISIEAIAQHTSDAVVAPLLWGAIAGAPGMFGARAFTVLRALAAQGGGDDRYSSVVAVGLDDAVNLLPARFTAALTVLAAPVVGGSARGAWRAWQLDTVAHRRPNAGTVTAAFAGALQIRLGGRTVYSGGIEQRPVVGDGRNPDVGHVTRAVALSRVVGWLAGVTSAVLAGALSVRRCRRPRRARRQR